MRMALLGNERINALESKSKYGEYKNDVYSQYRKASQEGALCCPDCGKPLVFRGGEHYQPHFAHKIKTVHCEADQIDVSEEHLKGQGILYYWLRDKKLGEVLLDQKYSNRRATVSLVAKEGTYAFHYIRRERKLGDWMDKLDELDQTGVRQFVIFSYRDIALADRTETQQFRKLTSKLLGGRILSLDTETEDIYVMKYIDIFDDTRELIKSIEFTRKYALDDARVFEHDLHFPEFEDEYNAAKAEERAVLHREKLRLEAEKAYVPPQESNIKKALSMMTQDQKNFFGPKLSVPQKNEIANHILNHTNYVAPHKVNLRALDPKIRQQIELMIPLTNKQLEGIAKYFKGEGKV